jgi:hypothetical protein
VFAETKDKAYQQFINELRIVGVSVDDVIKNPSISRYEVTYLLNLAECVDCLIPRQSMIDIYTSSFWDQFNALPGRDFRDIIFRQAYYQEQSYYYCVAYAGDRRYVSGYPLRTSPICG